MSTRAGRLLPVLIVAGFVVIAVAFSLRVPPFETPDEVNHFGFARNIAQGYGLPVQAATPTGPWEHEGSQPPLYYLITGALTSGIDQSDFSTLAQRNPHANIGNPLYPGNKNFMLFSGAAHPLRSTNLALHVGRWFSVVLGALTLWLTLLTARLALGTRDPRALLAMGVAASIPQFAFIHGSFSNDALITLMGTATMYWLARMVTTADAEAISWRAWLLLGVLLGAAALSKLQGLGLSVMAGLVILWLAWRQRQMRVIWRALPWVALPPLLIAGWWFARNWMLYGDITGTTLLLTLNGLRTVERDWADWWLEFRGLRYSFWGLFGWFNILLPQWYYTLMDALALIAMGGAALALGARMRRRSPDQQAGTRVLFLLAAWALLVTLLLFAFTERAAASQGRLLFPAISAIVTLGVLGMAWWLRLLRHPAGAIFWTAFFALQVTFSLYALVVLLPAAYKPAAAVAARPATAMPLDLRFAASTEIALVGASVPPRVAAGQNVPVTLYLTAPITPTHDDVIFVQLLDPEGDTIANVTTHPGWGRNPTTLWRAGALYPDAYELTLTRPLDNRSPLAARLYVGFVDPALQEIGPVATTNAAGEPAIPIIAEVVLEPPAPPTREALGLPAHGAVFGNVIKLAGAGMADARVTAGSVITATLLYEATGQPATEYSAFVHLLDSAGKQVAGYDQANAGGLLPTSLWRAGDRIAATFPIALPSQLSAGTYSLVTGLYESASAGARRLPVTNAAGHSAGDGWVEMVQVELP